MSPFFHKHDASHSEPSRSSFLDRIKPLRTPSSSSESSSSLKPVPVLTPAISSPSPSSNPPIGRSSSAPIAVASSQLPAPLMDEEIRTKTESVTRKLKTIRTTNAVFHVGQKLMSAAASAVSVFGGLAIVDGLSLVERMLTAVENVQINILDVLALIERAGKVVDIVAKGSVEFTSMVDGGVGGKVDPTSSTPVTRLLETLRETLAYLADSARNDGVFQNLVRDAFKDKQTLADFREQFVDALGDFNLECTMATINFQRNTTNDLRAVRQMVELLYQSNIDARFLPIRGPPNPPPTSSYSVPPPTSYYVQPPSRTSFTASTHSPSTNYSMPPPPSSYPDSHSNDGEDPSSRIDYALAPPIDLNLREEMMKMQAVLKQVFGVNAGLPNERAQPARGTLAESKESGVGDKSLGSFLVRSLAEETDGPGQTR